jgi:hypothetical protein
LLRGLTRRLLSPNRFEPNLFRGGGGRGYDIDDDYDNADYNDDEGDRVMIDKLKLKNIMNMVVKEIAINVMNVSSPIGETISKVMYLWNTF